MANQYFEFNPDLKEQAKEIIYSIPPHHLKLKTDAGVFSKGQVDYGSRVLVETLLENLSHDRPKRILELGSGYGPVILMLAKHFPKVQSFGVEINERAYRLSLENAERNQVENVRIFLGDASHNTFETVDLIVTNPPIRAGKTIVHSFVDRAYEQLSQEGEFYVVIQKKQGAASMEKKMASVFSNVKKIRQDKGYWILKSQKI